MMTNQQLKRAKAYAKGINYSFNKDLFSRKIWCRCYISDNRKVILSNGHRASCNKPNDFDYLGKILPLLRDNDTPVIAMGVYGYVAVDIDDCIHKEGGNLIINDVTKKIIKEYFPNDYLEVSMSASGIHILVKSDIEIGNRNLLYLGKQKIEIYSPPSSHFIALTGRIIQGRNVIKENNKIIDLVNLCTKSDSSNSQRQSMKQTENTINIKHLSLSRTTIEDIRNKINCNVNRAKILYYINGEDINENSADDSAGDYELARMICPYVIKDFKTFAAFLLATKRAKFRCKNYPKTRGERWIEKKHNGIEWLYNYAIFMNDRLKREKTNEQC